jgi:hypothetical protein
LGCDITCTGEARSVINGIQQGQLPGGRWVGVLIRSLQYPSGEGEREGEIDRVRGKGGKRGDGHMSGVYGLNVG